MRRAEYSATQLCATLHSKLNRVFCARPQRGSLLAQRSQPLDPQMQVVVISITKLNTQSGSFAFKLTDILTRGPDNLSEIAFAIRAADSLRTAGSVELQNKSAI